MGIYRGPGGTGDAVNDASSEALITIQARDAALAAQAAAEAAQTAAELAETNAETAETNAETAETNAETAATNAASSASAASTSASNAASSASAASTSASNASTSASNAASSASAASTSASNASTSASNAANSATSASNSASTATTQATNASNSASAAATSATNAANSATAAQTAQTAAELAETNAETAETNAETAETNAAASASAAATSASNASTSASNAATSATNASNSASAAATSATNASNSASAASTSASNAATSESNAAASASNAAASYDSFDDRYLGAKSTAPTLDNDGNTLLVGALYYDTVSSAMKVWSGSAWLDAYASLSGALIATNNLSDLNNTATARTNLGVAIGTNVQAWDADLDTWATKTAPSGTVVGTSDSQTLTNKTIALGSNTVSGTLAQFNTAVTDADLASIAGTETLTNKTLTSPTINTATISGGTINNAAIGGTTPAAGSFTSLTDSGNLTFTGTGNRVTGDMSNATFANRVLFQDSTTNGQTSLGVIPNGTASGSSVIVYNSSSPDNSSIGFLQVTNTAVNLNSSRLGSGTFLPLLMFTNGSERLRIDTSGNVGIGTSSPNSSLTVSKQITQLSGTGNTYGVHIYPTGTGACYVDALTNSSSNSSLGLRTYNNGTYTSFIENSAGNTTTFQTAGTERMRIDSSGNVGIGLTTNTSYKLQISGAGTQTFRITSTDGANADLSCDGTSSMSLGSPNGIPIRFVTNGTERMRITSGGNVGLGTTNPGARFEVAGTTTSTTMQITTTTGAPFTTYRNTGQDFYVGLDNSAGASFGSQYSANLYGTGAYPMLFWTNGIERMRIASNGALGFSGANYGSSGQVLTSNGSGSAPSWQNAAGITRATAVASTSGTSIDFTGIPSTVKRITVIFSGVSTSGSSHWLVQLGDSGGIENTGYSASSYIVSTSGGNGGNYTTGMGMFVDNSAFTMHGLMDITNINSNTWVSSVLLGSGTNLTGLTVKGAGTKTLSATLDRIRITTVNGTDTFDAGTVNIFYE